jgi:threonine/homoserine/homoserine lactone efflux protein
MALLSTGARFGLRGALPFVAGVVRGKQLIIWPIGFGLMEMADRVPALFTILKWACVAYICWLAWRIANMNLSVANDGAQAPGFIAGLVVHPLNPKAWAMITAGFTSFVSPGTPVLQATATIAICLAGCQLVLHPLWTLGGQKLARGVAGHWSEKYLMWTLAALTVASVFFVLFLGEKT